MQLIRKLGIRKSKTGKSYSSYGLFYCIFDNKQVIRSLSSGKESKSCGCVTNKLMSETRIKKGLSKGVNNPMYNIHRLGKDNPMYNKKHTEETKKRIAQANKGKKSYWKNKKLTEEYKQKIKDNHADVKMQNNPNWQGGKSFEPYSLEFNKELKNFIKERDNYICQDPDCKYKSKKLDIHHIDYDKKNNNIDNLITLCGSCHSKTKGKKRKYWVEFYQNKIRGIYNDVPN